MSQYGEENALRPYRGHEAVDRELPPRPSARVPAEMDGVEKRIIQVSDVAAHLRERLGLILGPGAPAVASNDQKGPPAGSELSSRLVRAESDIAVIGNILRDILDRVEV